MASEKQNNSFVTQLLDWLAQERQYHQLRITAIEQNIADLKKTLLYSKTKLSKKDILQSKETGLCKKLLEGGFQNLDDENFDLILNLRDQRLKFRVDPASHSELKSADFRGIGPHRMQILIYMLENPGISFHVGNISRAYSDLSEKPLVFTFTKTMSDFRKKLGQTSTKGPYIITTFDWDGITNRQKGAVYTMNPKWKYLVIRNKKISEETHKISEPTHS